MTPHNPDKRTADDSRDLPPLGHDADAESLDVAWRRWSQLLAETEPTFDVERLADAVRLRTEDAPAVRPMQRATWRTNSAWTYAAAGLATAAVLFVALVYWGGAERADPVAEASQPANGTPDKLLASESVADATAVDVGVEGEPDMSHLDDDEPEPRVVFAEAWDDAGWNDAVASVAAELDSLQGTWRDGPNNAAAVWRRLDELQSNLESDSL